MRTGDIGYFDAGVCIYVVDDRLMPTLGARLTRFKKRPARIAQPHALLSPATGHRPPATGIRATRAPHSHVGYRRGIADLLRGVIERVRELFLKYAFPSGIVDACCALSAAAVLPRIPVLLTAILSGHVRSLRLGRSLGILSCPEIEVTLAPLSKSTGNSPNEQPEFPRFPANRGQSAAPFRGLDPKTLPGFTISSNTAHRSTGRWRLN